MRTSKAGHFGTVSAKGWVVIPKEYREQLKLNKGAKVVIVEHGGMISITPLSEDPVSAAAGRFAEGPSLTEALLQDRREENMRADRKLGIKPPEEEEKSHSRVRS